MKCETSGFGDEVGLLCHILSTLPDPLCSKQHFEESFGALQAD